MKRHGSDGLNEKSPSPDISIDRKSALHSSMEFNKDFKKERKDRLMYNLPFQQNEYQKASGGLEYQKKQEKEEVSKS